MTINIDTALHGPDDEKREELDQLPGPVGDSIADDGHLTRIGGAGKFKKTVTKDTCR